jgi:hypothetical protein
MPKVRNRPKGENSPNQVTLVPTSRDKGLKALLPLALELECSSTVGIVYRNVEFHLIYLIASFFSLEN